jgi:glycosyltransferase involved in cell wall biosynthesis
MAAGSRLGDAARRFYGVPNRRNQMRIAIFSEVYWPMISGVACTLRRLADALEARGHAVRVYTATYDLPDGASDRPEVHRSPSRAFFLSPEVQWASPDRAAIVEDLRRFRPDVVHLATEAPMGRAGLRAAQALGVPIVASAHTDYERYAARYGVAWAVRPGWKVMRRFYRHAHVVLCPSRQYERHLHARGIRHTGIWSRGVDSAQFSPSHRSEAFRAALGCGPATPLVTYVGRIAPEKSVPVLLDAWARLGARRGDARLAFVGRGLLEDEIRRRALPGVSLLGMREGAALGEAYASADIFAFPSATETFGNVLLEAMASGLACVAAGTGGVLEFARDGANARLVAPHDPDALADALAALLASPAERGRLAAGALATARSRGWDAIYDGLLEDYDGAIAAGRLRLAA